MTSRLAEGFTLVSAGFVMLAARSAYRASGESEAPLSNCCASLASLVAGGVMFKMSVALGVNARLRLYDLHMLQETRTRPESVAGTNSLPESQNPR